MGFDSQSSVSVYRRHELKDLKNEPCLWYYWVSDQVQMDLRS